MTKRAFLGFVRFAWCFVLSAFLLGCVAPWQRMPTAHILPSPEEIEQERAHLSMDPELREELSELVAVSCQGADRQYLGQQVRDPLLELELRVVSKVLGWAYRKQPAQTQTNATDQPIVSGAEVVGPPLTIDDSRVQFGAGLVSGSAISAVPLGSTGAEVAIQLGILPNGTYWARVGKACGEIVVGTAQIVWGCTGITTGAGMSGTGAGAVVGIPIMAESMVIAANGCVTLGQGLAHAAQLLDEGPPQQSSAAPSEPALLKPKPAPAPEAPAAAAPPPKAAAPTPKAAPPTQPVTKTFTNPPPGVKKARNVHLAGKTHPKTGVPFDADGFPDFRSVGVVKKEVKITFTGDRGKDIVAANKEAHFSNTPENYTWHHHQDGTTMQLVPTSLHQATGHTGGFASGR